MRWLGHNIHRSQHPRRESLRRWSYRHGAAGVMAGVKAPTFGRPRWVAANAATAFETAPGKGLRDTSGSPKTTRVLLTGQPKNAPLPSAISATYGRPSRPRYVVVRRARSRAGFRGSGRRQRRSHRSMLERNARRCERDGRAVPRASGTRYAPAPPLPASVGTGGTGDGGGVDAGTRGRSGQGSTSRRTDRIRWPRNLDHNSSGNDAFVSHGGQAGHPRDRRKSLVAVS